MYHYLIYNLTTGAIYCTGSAYTLAEISADMPEGHGALLSPISFMTVRGKIVVDGELVDDPNPPTIDIEELRASAREQIHQIVGELRRQFITVIPGQEMIYTVKEAEAKAIQELIASGVTPDPIEFPFLQAEVELRTELEDLVDASAFILAQASILRSVGAPLEKIRLGAIMQINLAQTPEEVSTAIEMALEQIALIAA